jgi:hypothetical protein
VLLICAAVLVAIVAGLVLAVGGSGAAHAVHSVAAGGIVT